jgi:UDP-galactopyranose mutase
MYDYLIVGAGLYGSVFAYEMTKAGKKCLVLEKRDHIGGNVYTKKVNNIHVHEYGPHIFHTSNKKIWDYVNQFATFNNFINRPKVYYREKIYSFPINLLTLYQVWGITAPVQAKLALKNERLNIANPQNLEEWCLSQIGPRLYEIFIKGYTQKQWKTDPKNLPASIIKRIPVRLNYDDNYYFDTYQGIPIGGYTQIFEKLLKDVPVQLNVDYLIDKTDWNKKATRVIYTGPIDAYFDYSLGDLEYRTTQFVHTQLYTENDFQGNAIINYTDINVPYTRIIEHKHFDWVDTPGTIITQEYPDVWSKDKIPYYPINNTKNNTLYDQYFNLSKTTANIKFAGRLGKYCYYDMHQIIGAALHDVKVELNT